MKVRETAIILTGVQNDFCSKDGVLYGVIEKILAENSTIENIIDLIEKAREKGILTLFVPIIFTEDYRELKDPVGILKTIKDVKAFRKGSKGAEIIQELEPYIDYMQFVKAKRGLCAFGDTDLDEILEEKDIKHVAIGGLLTNICVESTARTAYDRGYEVTILKDCTACRSFEEQKYSEEYIFPLLGKVMTHEEFLDALVE